MQKRCTLRTQRRIIPTNFVPKTNAEIPDGSTLQGEVARFPEIGPTVTPGSSYDYSNPGYNTLAAVIEVAYGETIDRFLADVVFKPLEMNDTYAYWRGQPRNGLPPVYEKKNGAWEIVHEDEAPFARGSGGLVSQGMGLRMNTRRGLGCFHQQEAQQRIALLADVSKSLLASTGVLTRNHPHVRADLLAALKPSWSSDDQHVSQCRNWTDTGMRH